MDKTVGILGGMGPEATAVFFQELIRGTRAEKDQDHLKVVIVNDPKIPDRTEHLLRGGPTPLPALRAAARDLERLGADLIAMPCNTAHAYFDQIQSSVEIPILHIVEETVRKTSEVVRKRGRIGIMSTRATLHLELYQRALLIRGFEPVTPNADMQRLVSDSIAALKGQENRDRASAWLTSAAAGLKHAGCQAILLACTELGLASIDVDIPRLDSLKILAEATLRLALGDRSAVPSTPSSF